MSVQQIDWDLALIQKYNYSGPRYTSYPTALEFSEDFGEQAKYLRSHGVHILQGYLYAQPMPLRDFPKWLAGSQPPPARHNGHITPIMPLR